MLSTIFLYLLMLAGNTGYYKTTDGKVTFESKATNEKIISTSNNLHGIINTNTNTFSFKINLETFHGFNSELQKEHYKENYVESDRFPIASFSGKIIEDIDYTRSGTYPVRAKGSFQLHGLTLTKIINGSLTVINTNQITIISSFQLSLKEYNIKIPRLVHKKVAENIVVKVDIVLNRQ